LQELTSNAATQRKLVAGVISLKGIYRPTRIHTTSRDYYEKISHNKNVVLCFDISVTVRGLIHQKKVIQIRFLAKTVCVKRAVLNMT